MTKNQAIEKAISEGLVKSSDIALRANEILSSNKQNLNSLSKYDSLSSSSNRNKGMNPLFREQNYEIYKLTTSSAGEYLSEGRNIFSLCKTKNEKIIAALIYNEIRDRIGRGFIR